MFGTRLKSWMEQHLGRPRQKAGQNQKSSRKETAVSVPDFSGIGASGCTTTTTSTTTVISDPSTVSGALSSSNGNPYPVGYNNLLREQKQLERVSSNLDASSSSKSADLFQSTTHNSNSNHAATPSSSSVQIQSAVGVVAQCGAQQQQQNQKQESANHSTKDYDEEEEKVEEQDHHHHHPGEGGTTSCPRSSTTGSVSTSHNILLGTFCNNLSSPDTGYSTDGYSPKSVYPALSFESGKSTPKSSYTISSLVSSELHLSSSKGNTASLSSASCSINNGLESDHEFTSPTPRIPLKTSASLPPHSETDRSHSNNLGLGDGHVINEKGASQDNSPRGGERASHSINQVGSKQPLLGSRGSTTRDSYRGNDSPVSGTQCHSTKSSVNNASGDSWSHQQPPLPTLGEGSGGSMVAAKQPLSNFTSQSIREEQGNNGGSCNPNSAETHNCSHKSTNPFCGNQIQSSPSFSAATPDNNHYPRTDISENERKSSVLTTSPLRDYGEGSNSSSVLTASSSNRNIRTSFVLVTTATSQIQECSNSFACKNSSFSISSPSKRTRIKTNGSLMILHGNSNANKVELNSPGPVIRVNNKEKGGSGPGHRFSSLSESAVLEKVVSTMHSDNRGNGCEINRRGGGEIGMDHRSNGESSSLVYRISTSASASDSGKGSLDLDPGTNRNSTESSCLLSDSASTRNSIISHETGCSRSSSTSSASASLFLLPNNEKTEEYNKHSVSRSSVKVGVNNSSKVVLGTGSGCGSSAKSTPSSVKKYTPKMHINNNLIVHESSNQLEDLDATSTSITLPPEYRSSASVSAQTNVIMVDKETDILSDWANTDDDGEDEIETDRNEEDDDDYEDEDEDRVTPTPSSPDTDTGGRVMFHRSQSTSSVTDIDFGDSSAATAASSNGIAPSSSIFRSQYTQNVASNRSTNKGKSNGSVPPMGMDSYQHHHNNIIMRPQPTCYTIPHNPTPQHDDHGWNEGGMFATGKTQGPENDNLFQQGLTKSGVMCPTGHPVGIPNAHISLSSSLYPELHEDYNANKPPNSSSSNAIARGALGFLRKIFKKGSCSSSHRTSPGSDKVKIPRSAKSKDSHLDNIASITGLRSTSLLTTTADALVSPHPLVGRKSTINGYFLTPTPNAFRRRSTNGANGGGNGTDSSDSTKGGCGGGGSKHAKNVKTDIIRIPPGALSPTNNFQHANSSSSTASSKNTSIGAFCISSLQNNTYAAGNGNNNTATGYSNTNTNSNSTASSIHSMSTSTSASTNGGGGLLLGTGGEMHATGHTPSSRRVQNQSRLNDNFYLNSNSNSNRQSPYLSNEVRSTSMSGGSHHPILVGTHSNPNPQPPPLPPVPQSPYGHHRPSPNTFQSHANHQRPQTEREFGNGYRDRDRPPSRTGPCPYESPRLSNPHHRINSPSFNNYSPIHRLVVTSGAQQLLNRGGGGGPSHNNPSNCASPFPHESSPNLPSRNNGVGPNHHHNNNTSSGTAGLTPNINRSTSFHPNPTSNSSSPSPLINHHPHPESSISSPHRPHLPPSNTFTSPSPILRNPRYQYITSSNQNSPVLNVPRRMNGSVPNHPPQGASSNHQQNYFHNQNNPKQDHGKEGGGSFPNGPQQPPPTFSTFSPTPPPPPPRQISSQPNNNPFSNASPNLNHHQLHSQVPINPGVTNPHKHRGSVEFEVVNSPNPNLHRSGGPENNPLPPGSSSNNRNKLLSRSQSYQPQPQSHPVHYYASPVVPQPPQPETGQRMFPQIHPHQHPTSLTFNEPPLLMRAHLHNQNVRFNNFLRNKQRTQQTPLVEQFPHSESFQERIYESVDSVEEEEDENRNVDDEGTTTRLHHHNDSRNRDHYHHQQQQPYYFHPNTNGVLEQLRQNKNRLPTPTSNLESGFPFSNKSHTGAGSKTQSSKSKRSKAPSPVSRGQCDEQGESGSRPRPPVPMSFFGPNTFLSETETRLLETDEREADRKYKRLISEAESLLMEISNLKKEPWAQPQQQSSRMVQDRMKIEDCPQSDPLRRKAYDCWALRRLQQELAGCCASPPVLHRSRMNLQSPGTPTAAAAAMLNPYFSLVPNSQMANTNLINSHSHNVHF